MSSYIRQFLIFLKDIVKSRWLLWELTKLDFKKRYLGSYLGILWGFIQPTINVLLFWFVFQVGFKSIPIDNFPFILWLVTGLFPWFFFSEALAGATNAIIESSYLVQKVVFRVSILPIVKISSALIIHFFFLVVLVAMFVGYGYPLTLYNLQALYYLFASICLLMGLSWLTSSIVVFLRDASQVVGMVIQIGFWITPIFWPFKSVPENYQSWLLLNPLYYIIEGYRNSFIYNKWFWEDWIMTLYFWSVTIVIFGIGAIVFRKLRPHFADVL